MLRPWSQQARQRTPRRGIVTHLGNRGCCVHIHTGGVYSQRYHDIKDAWSMVTAGGTANTTEGNRRYLENRGCCVHIHTGGVYSQRYHDKEDASSMATAGATPNTTERNGHASRESRLLCSHSHGGCLLPKAPRHKRCYVHGHSRRDT